MFFQDYKPVHCQGRPIRIKIDSSEFIETVMKSSSQAGFQVDRLVFRTDPADKDMTERRFVFLHDKKATLRLFPEHGA